MHQHVADRHTPVDSPVVAKIRVRLVSATGHRVFRNHFKTVLPKPIEGVRCVPHGQLHKIAIDGVLTDANDVVEVFLRCIFYSLKSLHLGTGSTHLAGREKKRSAELRCSFNEQHAGSATRCKNCGRQSCSAAANDDQVPAFRGSLGSETTRRGKPHRH